MVLKFLTYILKQVSIKISLMSQFLITAVCIFLLSSSLYTLFSLQYFTIQITDILYTFLIFLLLNFNLVKCLQLIMNIFLCLINLSLSLSLFLYFLPNIHLLSFQLPPRHAFQLSSTERSCFILNFIVFE